MNEQHDLEVTYLAMTDTTPLPIIITIPDAWLLHNALDLASKFPALHEPMHKALRDIAWKFKKAILARHPEVKPLFKAGGSFGDFWKGAEEAMSDSGPLTVDLTIAKVWLMISALQLVDRKPDLPKRVKRKIKALALQLQQRIEDHHPEATSLLNRGWDPTYDVDAN